ncbi:MAG: pyridoxamine 5'-phosphate oxidase, partial [Candidatus Omnitrophota bacterium]
MNINQKLQSTHRQYHLASLDKKDLSEEPMDLFRQWFDLAVKKGLPTPDAANLATASKLGRPSSRIVLIKSIDQNKFTFFSSYVSQKAKEIQA